MINMLIYVLSQLVVEFGCDWESDVGDTFCKREFCLTDKIPRVVGFMTFLPGSFAKTLI